MYALIDNRLCHNIFKTASGTANGWVKVSWRHGSRICSALALNYLQTKYWLTHRVWWLTGGICWRHGWTTAVWEHVHWWPRSQQTVCFAWHGRPPLWISFSFYQLPCWGWVGGRRLLTSFTLYTLFQTTFLLISLSYDKLINRNCDPIPDYYIVALIIMFYPDKHFLSWCRLIYISFSIYISKHLNCVLR